MKKNLLFLVVFAWLFSSAAWAYDFETDGIYYNILSSDNKTVKVTYKSYSYVGGYKSDYSGDVTIPATVTHNGTEYRVTAIGYCAFYDCTRLTSVTIPNSVTAIHPKAFSGCTSLTSVTIPDGVTSIGEQAFSGCTKLKSVTIPESITFIFRDAFLDCTGLNAVHISDMAAWCKISFHKYDTVVVDSGTYPYKEISWATNPLQYAHNLYLDDNLVTDLKIPEDITSIGAGAFYGCTSLTSVTIPKGVVSVGEAAFSGCTGLKAVYISDVAAWCKINFSPTEYLDYGWTDYSWGSNPLTCAHNLYLDGKLATDLKIPEGVTTICKGAFSRCSGLKSITIPKSVTTIDSDAFSGCTGLNAVHISDVAAWCKIAFRSTGYSSTYRIASNPLYYAHNLYLNDSPVTELTIPEGIKFIGTEFQYCTNISSVSIPNSVTTIGASAFEGCTGLTSVTIPESVTTIGGQAFSGCTKLKSVTIPESVTTIGDNAFWNCSGLTSVTIPENVTTIGYKPFRNCDGLKEVWFNADSCTITMMGYDVFNGCMSLKTVHIGENVKYFPGNIFYGCTGLEKFEGKWASNDNRCLIVKDTLVAFAPSGLTKYTIPNGVTTIGGSAFYDCNSLTEITIPESVTSIGSYAFSYCSNLQTITPLGTIPPTISYYTFDSYTYKNATVNYPKSSLHAYKTADGWKNFTYPTVQELLNLHFTADSVGETKYHCTVSYTRDVDYPVSKLYMAANEKEYPVDADTTLAVIPVTIIDLEPETEYDAQFIIETIYGDQIVTPVTFTTDTVHLTAQPAKTTDVKATLEAAVECDAETGYGFEWRRYGAPENLPPTRVEAYNIDGKIAGTLRNLTPNTYYEFRPYYRTVSGQYYYDEWVAFGTFDSGVEWDPTVSTRAGEVEGNNSTISAYVVEGSDELLSQGFEYWTETPATRSTASNPERIEGSGSLMSVTLTGLDYNTTYYYRAYATTAKKTTYGNTESFTTGKAPVVQDFKPTGITPTDNSEVEALKTFTLEFAEAPSLAVKAQPITLAGKDTLITATLAAGEENTLVATLADTLKTVGEYTLTIPEGTFGDADFADDPTVGHCNPVLTYTYTIKEPEPVEPDEPENPDKPDEPIVPDEPDEPSSITETQADAEHIAVYNLQGVLVLETDDAADLKTLQSGAYIVNGKKMIIAR